MSVFAAAIDVLFADPHLARPAVYRIGAADPGLPVRMIVRRPDRIAEFGATRLVATTTVVEVRVADVAEPRAGDTVEVDGAVHVLQGEPVADAERLVWTLEARPL